MGSRTPLYDQHVAASARIVDFGGWDMPLHYGSQKEEHHAVRQNAGVFDVSHMTIVDLSGDFRLKSADEYASRRFRLSWRSATALTSPIFTPS